MERERETERDTVTVQSTKHEGMGQCVSGSYSVVAEKKKTSPTRYKCEIKQFDVVNPTNRSSFQCN